MSARHAPVWSVLCLLLPPAAADEGLLQAPTTEGTFFQEVREFHGTDQGLPGSDVRQVAIVGQQVFAETDGGWAVRDPNSGTWSRSRAPRIRRDLSRDARATRPERRRSERTLLPWTHRIPSPHNRLPVRDDRHSWLPIDPVVVHSPDGTWWFAESQGVGCLHNGQWTLYTPADGVPYTDFTCAAVDDSGRLWLGTTRGVVRFDGTHWAYRQGKRWLPADDVRCIAIAKDGSAWIATSGGLARIRFQPMTLKDKAAFYETEIDRYNRRTEFGYVLEAHCARPGDKSELSHHDSDNDGLWTSMYGAGECFAWAATKDPQARKRARQAFEALRFLSIAPRGGSHPAPRGFIARTVLPTTEPDPNKRPGHTLDGQKKSRQRDALWRVYEPRWPVTEDGRYYWKSDTSSDELDGHYFFYGLYFDLVADTEEEKERVREIVRDNIDHLIEHDFRLHDHAGPTRWANYNPESLNHDPRWAVERGLNSLSMLSYLATAAHITGDSRYHDVAAELRDRHGYAQNLLVPKIQAGIGTGNQSDDEMAFMCFYNLLKYEPDEQLRKLYRFSFLRYWILERPELNPFFNFCYAAGSDTDTYTDQWGTMSLNPGGTWLDESIETLRRFPLDRFNWAHTNSHRLDLVTLPGPALETRGRQMRVNERVIPVDECHFNHWNRNPWDPDTGGDGRTLSDGTVFLLPYYMGLYHGFIK